MICSYQKEKETGQGDGRHLVAAYNKDAEKEDRRIHNHSPLSSRRQSAHQTPQQRQKEYKGSLIYGRRAEPIYTRRHFNHNIYVQDK